MGPLAVLTDSSVRKPTHSRYHVCGDSLPVRGDLRASRDGRRELTRAEIGAVGVAGEERVGRVRQRVVSVPLALDAALAGRRVVCLESVENVTQ